MAINLYKTWMRPSLMIFTDTIPNENNAIEGSWNIGDVAGTDYIFLTDDNRSDLQVSTERIEYKRRMINGRMRSYHVADKRSFSVTFFTHDVHILSLLSTVLSLLLKLLFVSVVI